MSDIALVQVSTDETGPRFDFALDNGNLVLDQGLTTPVILSLFCDRLAAADDAVPDGSTNRRGWWADLPLDGETPPDAGLAGSRLWLLERSVALAQTRSLSMRYGNEALSWLMLDKVIAAAECTATWTDTGNLLLSVSVAKSADGRAADTKYSVIWSGTI